MKYRNRPSIVVSDQSYDKISLWTLQSIISSLSEEQPSIPDELLYDDIGSNIFDKLVSNPEYYPAVLETEIINSNSEFIAKYKSWDIVVELGSGSSRKTINLLNSISKYTSILNFYPIDINKSIMEKEIDLNGAGDNCEFIRTPLVGFYEDGISYASSLYGRKLVLFLGSSTSQLTDNSIYTSISSMLGDEDRAIISFDLDKDPNIILNTYNLSEVREHAINGIKNINKYLESFIDIKYFEFVNIWNEEKSRSETHMYARKDVELSFKEKKIFVKAGSSIRTAVQQKFSFELIENLLTYSNLCVEKYLCDTKMRYTVCIVRRKINK